MGHEKFHGICRKSVPEGTRDGVGHGRVVPGPAVQEPRGLLLPPWSFYKRLLGQRQQQDAANKPAVFFPARVKKTCLETRNAPGGFFNLRGDRRLRSPLPIFAGQCHKTHPLRRLTPQKTGSRQHAGHGPDIA